MVVLLVAHFKEDIISWLIYIQLYTTQHTQKQNKDSKIKKDSAEIEEKDK